MTEDNLIIWKAIRVTFEGKCGGKVGIVILTKKKRFQMRTYSFTLGFWGFEVHALKVRSIIVFAHFIKFKLNLKLN